MKPKQLAKIMKALSNETRISLYFKISKHEESNFKVPECNISEIVRIFGLSAPTISHHIKELANADLITTERRGKHLVARINKETMSEVMKMLHGIQGK